MFFCWARVSFCCQRVSIHCWIVGWVCNGEFVVMPWGVVSLGEGAMNWAQRAAPTWVMPMAGVVRAGSGVVPVVGMVRVGL